MWLRCGQHRLPGMNGRFSRCTHQWWVPRGLLAWVLGVGCGSSSLRWIFTGEDVWLCEITHFCSLGYVDARSVEGNSSVWKPEELTFKERPLFYPLRRETWPLPLGPGCFPHQFPLFYCSHPQRWSLLEVSLLNPTSRPPGSLWAWPTKQSRTWPTSCYCRSSSLDDYRASSLGSPRLP